MSPLARHSIVPVARGTSIRYARSGGLHVAYQDSGAGPPDLRLVPDGVIPIESMGELPAFDRSLRRLESFARVIRFDRRGMGLSDPTPQSSPPTLERWMEDAIAVLDAVESERTALLGMAEGGFVTALLAGSGIGFDDRGTHELKGVPDEWHLFAVTPGSGV